MSGIVGLLRRDGGAVPARALDAALSRLRRRGPDGVHAWSDGSVALGCALHRTSVCALAETLPLVDRGRSLAVVHDARIDNRDETARALESSSRGDGALLLDAWERWGTGMLEHLLGDFALAVWDGGRRTLLLARDQIGARSLFYAVTPQVVAFASEVKALLALAGVPRTLDPVRVAEYMAGFAADRGATFRAGIRRLAAGEALVATATSVRTTRYHELTLPDRVHQGTAAEVADGFREVLARAVRDRVDAACGVAAMLSGGLDSSAIVHLAREALHDAGTLPLPVVSFAFPRTPACDEAPFVAAVAAQGGLAAHTLDCDALSPLARLDDLLDAIDEPFDGPHMVYRLEVGRLARALGIGAVLEGNGGDAVVSSGLFFLADLARRGRLLRLARELRLLRARLGLSPRAALFRFALAPNVPAVVRRVRRLVAGATATYPTPPLLSRELVARTRLDERFEVFWHRRPSPRGEREHHLREVVETLPGSTYPLTYGAHGVEPRFPFRDRRVIEYCLAVPPEYKLADGLTRALPRRAFAGRLPAAVLARTRKTSPAASLVARFVADDRAAVEEALAAAPAEYLDVPALRSTFARVASWSTAHPGATPPAPLYLEFDQVRKAVVLSRWLASAGASE